MRRSSARFHTYAVEVSAAARAYMDAVMALPAWAEWREAARREPWVLPHDEVDWPEVLARVVAPRSEFAQARRCFKLAQQRPLIGENLDHGDRQREIGDAVDLRKSLPASRFRRPLDFERIAGERRKIEVGLERPGVDDLAAFLLDRRKREELARGGQIRLLGEFSPRRGEQIGAGFGEALGDRPHPVVLLGPERPARMREQDFEPFLRRNAKSPALISAVRRIRAGPHKAAAL